jgi:hypothetical protein
MGRSLGVSSEVGFFFFFFFFFFFRVSLKLDLPSPVHAFVAHSLHWPHWP